MAFSVYLFVFYYTVTKLLMSGKCQDLAFPCVTWDDTVGVCVDADSCSGFREALNKSKSYVTDLWVNSQCYKYDPSTVCCGFYEGRLYFALDVEKLPVVSSTTAPPTTPAISYGEILDQYRTVINSKLLFSPDRCGKQQADNPLIEQTFTSSVEPDEFTWMAHIIPKESTKALCTGVLINPRFVLTSYSCGFNAEKVRLGVYRLNETTTCVVTSPNDNFLDCKVTVEERNVEFISDPNNIPEVGILKLERGVIYNDFIRPLCLPFEENVKPEMNQHMFVSGWNMLDDEGGKYSKQKLAYRLAHNECNDPAISSNLDEEKAFCLVALHNLTVNKEFAEGTEPILYQYNSGSWYLAGFRWLSISSDKNANEMDSKRILGGTITLHSLKWVLDQIQLMIKT